MTASPVLFPCTGSPCDPKQFSGFYLKRYLACRLVLPGYCTVRFSTSNSFILHSFPSSADFCFQSCPDQIQRQYQDTQHCCRNQHLIRMHENLASGCLDHGAKTGSCAGIPTPIKLKNASVKIACGTRNVRLTTIGPAAFGKRWVRKIRRGPAPASRDARTNSRS